jgi:hypothetical protein
LTAVGRHSLVFAALLLVVACGRPGPPQPPERVSPLPASELNGVVVERAVEVSLTIPTRRADNARLRDLLALHVFRAEDDGSGDPKPALVVGRAVAGYAEVATVRIVDPAPASLHGTRMTLVDRGALTPGRRYTYVVLAEDARGHMSPPSTRLSVVLIAIPTAPGGLEAVAGDREVRLAWRPPARLQDNAVVETPLAYEILRAPAADVPPTPVATTAPGATSFVDRDLDNERSYVYAVRALRTTQGTVARGETSQRVAATPVHMTPPGPPTDLVGIPSEATVRLVWIASPDRDVGRYIVYRGREGAALERVGSTGAPGNTFTDRDVPAGRWRYAVSAQDTSSRANESLRSAEVTVTVP